MLQIFKNSFLLILVISNFSNAHPSPEESQKIENNELDRYRLPTSIKPENYKLEIYTHLNDSEGFIFRGIVAITLNVDESCDNITLHSKNLTIDFSKIELTEDTKNEAIKILNAEFMTKNDFLIIHTEKSLLKHQKYILKIPFEGSLDSDLFGYYRSSYFDKEAGERRWLSITQFEAIYAREAFPCFDEPAMKATFDISLAHHKKYNALSNMPLKESKNDEIVPDFVVDTFDTSVKMSTYLVAYSISDFEYKEVSMKDGVTFRIYARREAINQVDYAAEIGPKVLKFYEDYFQIKFPLPKIDMIAVPDFYSGAMENWGLITYRELALLYQANVSTEAAKHRVAEVIIHELAHQWFGNLVTMKWWTDLWLNEGFATYVSTLGIAHAHPEWKSSDGQTVERVLNIFNIDALKSSHPISVEIGHPNQIRQNFDEISYAKGSLVLRMAHKFLGENAFRFGVSKYLKKYQYDNTVQDDLWDSWTESSHDEMSLDESFSARDIMDSWTLQVGYPVIEVVRDYETNSATLTQSRYVSDRFAPINELNSCWWIPLTYTSAVEINFTKSTAQDWMTCDKNKKAVSKKIENLPDKNHWIIFNTQLFGLYRIKYDKQNYKLIIDTLNSEKFDVIDSINRAQLIDDAMNFAWSGRQNYKAAFDILKYLKRETEYIPWKAALDNLQTINRLIFDSMQLETFKKFMRQILDPIYTKLGGINEVLSSSQSDAVKHQLMICSWSCRFNVGDCIKRSVEYFNEWMTETEPDYVNPIPLNLRQCIYCAAIRNGDEKQWMFLWQRYLNSNVDAERHLLFSALGCSKDQKILERYLDWSLNSTLVKSQNANFVFQSIVGDEFGYKLARDFFFNRIDGIHGTSRLIPYIKSLVRQMSSANDLYEFKKLVTKRAKLFEEVTQEVNRGLEVIELNNKWKNNSYFSFLIKLTDEVEE